MEYKEFLEKKKHSSIDIGIDINYIPDMMFDFQKYVLKYIVKRGRSGVFLDTGTGKTLIELATAVNYIKHTNKPVLIITPLAVAFQFIKEAKIFNIPESIEYSRDGKYKSNIVICNYEMLNKFNYNDFDCVILDESSILKNFKGAIKNEVTSFLKKVKYRFLFTATPSPNDFIELGTSSEALGYLGYTDMLTKYFYNNEDTISPLKIGTKFILKGNAKNAFFEWVSSWSISMRKPSDLGFSDERYILPDLILNHNPISNDKSFIINGQVEMYPRIAKTMTEIKQEQKYTVEKRCEKAVSIANNHKTSVYWCNRNDEGDLLNKLDPDSYQINGSMKLEKKEEILLAFSNGEINKLITKPTITAFGLNWQHCNHTVYFPTFSYEQYYQAIRRFWRFGQTKPVTVDLVYSDGQKRVLDSLLRKTQKANELFNKLNSSLNSNYQIKIKSLTDNINIPKFI